MSKRKRESATSTPKPKKPKLSPIDDDKSPPSKFEFGEVTDPLPKKIDFATLPKTKAYVAADEAKRDKTVRLPVPPTVHSRICSVCQSPKPKPSEEKRDGSRLYYERHSNEYLFVPRMAFQSKATTIVELVAQPRTPEVEAFDKYNVCIDLSPASLSSSSSCSLRLKFLES